MPNNPEEGYVTRLVVLTEGRAANDGCSGARAPSAKDNVGSNYLDGLRKLVSGEIRGRRSAKCATVCRHGQALHGLADARSRSALTAYAMKDPQAARLGRELKIRCSMCDAVRDRTRRRFVNWMDISNASHRASRALVSKILEEPAER